MQYLRNGKYNYDGQVTREGRTSLGTFVLVSAVKASGNWSVHDDHLTTEHVDSKSTLLSLQLNGKPVDLMTMQRAGIDFSKLEFSMPIGRSSDFELISLDDAQMTVRSSDPQGQPFAFQAIKRI